MFAGTSGHETLLSQNMKADCKLNCLSQAQAGSVTVMFAGTSGHETLLSQNMKADCKLN
ncbi:hypothetical protein AVEN_229568-1, partial [Araneus ventricosus]